MGPWGTAWTVSGVELSTSHRDGLGGCSREDGTLTDLAGSLRAVWMVGSSPAKTAFSSTVGEVEELAFEFGGGGVVADEAGEETEGEVAAGEVGDHAVVREDAQVARGEYVG